MSEVPLYQSQAGHHRHALNHVAKPSKITTQMYKEILNRCVVVTEAGSYLRLIDFCITQLKAQGPSRTCNESKEEEEKNLGLPAFSSGLR